MGNPSFFEQEEITVKDMEGLKQFLKEFDKRFGNEGDYANIIKDGTVTFNNWNEYKIIQYCYPTMLLFLEIVAQFIEGYVVFEYDDMLTKASIGFSDNKCTISITDHTITYQKILETMMKNKKSSEQYTTYEVIQNVERTRNN